MWWDAGSLSNVYVLLFLLICSAILGVITGVAMTLQQRRFGRDRLQRTRAYRDTSPVRLEEEAHSLLTAFDHCD